jgi:tellurite resistance protein TerC
VLEKLEYLKVGLALVLIFVGAKMIAEPWLKISVELSLGIVIGMLLLTVLFSLLAKKKALQ